MLGFRKKITLAYLGGSLGISSILFVVFGFLRPEMKVEVLCMVGATFLVSLIHWFFLARILRPMQKIIQTIQSYELGKEELLPTIPLDDEVLSSDFGRLALTLNALGRRVKKQIEHLSSQTRETEEILESLGEGVIAVDSQARVKFMNSTACQMLKLSQSELLCKRLDSVSKDPFTQECQELILHALQASEPSLKTVRTSDRPPLFLDLFTAPLVSQTGAILVIQDKTHTYQILEFGKDFIANASHELRTPITIIRGFAETLQDMPELSREMMAEMTQKIVRTCIRLEKLVKSLITLSDIEHVSEKRFSVVDFMLLVHKSKELLLGMYQNTLKPEVEIQTHHKEIPIFADMDLVELAITNLLENAFKYSPSNTHISLSVEVKEEEVFLHVQDRGIGISELDLPHVFERFYTVDKARSRKSGGAGLGLSIVKNILEKHKGRVFARSELGVGSIFTLVLPLYRS